MAETCDGAGKAGVGGHAGADRLFDQLAGVGARCLVTQPQEGKFIAVVCRGGRGAVAQRIIERRGGAGGRDLIEGGDLMAGTDVPCVDLVIVEILAPQRAGFIADQAVFGDGGGVEFHLDFHVIGDGEQRAG